MHRSHLLLPHFTRLADGRVVQRSRPDRAALAAATAEATQPSSDPLLVSLANEALAAPGGGAVIASLAGARTTIDPPAGGGCAILGLKCAAGTAAVASAVPCATVWADGGTRHGVLAWSVNRWGESLAIFRGPPDEGVATLSALTGTLLDLALCALGRGTPPCPSPTVWFPDGVFLHRLAKLFDRHNEVCPRRRLSWDSLSLLYPLNVSGEPLSPCVVRHLRRAFHQRNTWTSLRRGVVTQPASAPAILPGLTSEVAAWLDDGSFARWVLNRLSDPPSTLEWLCERVDAGLADELSLALGEVHSAGGEQP